MSDGIRLEGIHDLPVVPVRAQVLFPMALMPLAIGREASLQALDSAGERRLIAIVSQRDPAQDAPGFAGLHEVGTVATVHRQAKLAQDQNTVVAMVQGLQRVRVVRPLHEEPYLRAEVEVLQDQLLSDVAASAEFDALQRSVRDLFSEVIGDSPNVSDDIIEVVRSISDPSLMADSIASALMEAPLEERQRLLEALDVQERLRLVMEVLLREQESQRLRNQIREQVKEKLTGAQREMVLREQLKAIKKELGEDDESGADELDDLRGRLEEADLPDEVRTRANREVERLQRIPPASPEYNVARTYLEWLVDLPWNRTGGTTPSMQHARRILDEDHYDLEKIKDRILEYLAVMQLKRDLKGPILCFVGPPGVGKTSLGKSIARATGREFLRLSLGGMHDEAEIRGHRRTYVGALPGQIVQGLRRAGTCDPVFMLDEVDKLGRDFRGDPAAALLEVLDPEQNSTFRDHYLDLPFDLSRVLFVTTANLLEPIPPPLRDRMEVIELSGYVEEEKLRIATRYLVPRQIEANGLTADQIEFTEAGIRSIIHGYTHEAGVRMLEQRIGAICRKRAKQVVTGADGADGSNSVTVTPEVVRELLGLARFREESELEKRTSAPGVAVALAWTPYGGEILFVESSRISDGSGRLTITGQVRDVMQESVKAAVSWIRANADRLGLPDDVFKGADLHIHIPAGAVPKDGPSAGVVITASLMSLITRRPVRHDVAMTGEITLSGFVLPVGGIKEKVLAARRAGVRELVLPHENEADVIEDVPPHLREGLTFHYVETLEEALEHAFDEGVPHRQRPSPLVSPAGQHLPPH